MIDNPNPNGFYTDREMVDRRIHISNVKLRLLKNLIDLTNKIKDEEPFPDGNIDLDELVEINDGVGNLLSKWCY